MNKDLIKEKWLEWKPKVIVLLCLVGAFVSGYTAGSLGDVKPISRQLNYTTNAVSKPPVNNAGGAPASKTVGQGSECPVKGSGSKIYHVKGGAFYDRTTAVACFQTEAEAEAAGYRKSSR